MVKVVKREHKLIKFNAPAAIASARHEGMPKTHAFIKTFGLLEELDMRTQTSAFEGYMWKAPPKGSSILSSWRKRWCILEKTGILTYYYGGAGEKDSWGGGADNALNKRKSLNLRGATIVALPATAKKEGRFRICVTESSEIIGITGNYVKPIDYLKPPSECCAMREFVFEALSKREGYMWLGAMLRAAGKGKDGNLNSEAWALFEDVNSTKASQDWITAVKESDLHTLEKLLKYGEPIDAVDLNGRSALHFACALGQQETIKFLINHGAEMNKRDKDGMTPLLHFVRAFCYARGDAEAFMIQYLVKNGSSIWDTQIDGFNALHFAAYHGNAIAAIELLRSIHHLGGKPARYLPWILHCDSRRQGSFEGDAFAGKVKGALFISESLCTASAVLCSKTPYDVANFMFQSAMNSGDANAVAGYARVLSVLKHAVHIIVDHPYVHSFEINCSTEGDVVQVTARSVTQRAKGQTAFRTSTWN